MLMVEFPLLLAPLARVLLVLAELELAAKDAALLLLMLEELAVDAGLCAAATVEPAETLA